MRSSGLASIAATILLAGNLGTAQAQFISIKTVPIATGDQFLLQPSSTLGMGGISVATDDALLDPFVNPAKGARLTESWIFGSPTFYGISQNGGGARSLPLGAAFGGERVFGAVSFSLQQLNRQERFWGGPFIDRGWQQDLLSERSATNRYLFGSLGSTVGPGLSVGASVSWADLNAVEGVDLLYGLADEIDQFGSAIDLRVGLLRELEGDRSFEALALYNRVRMTHDVTYLDWVWDEFTPGELVRRDERNLDRTNTYGLHLGYQQPLNDSGWRVGGILTANYKSHPKIPNYEIMNIPRDPGNSWAYNIGVGISRIMGHARFGAEVIIEPIISNTWAEADTPTPTASGRTLVVGARTIENDFTFSNALLRLGLARDAGKVGFQVGLQIKSIDYDLDQVDNVAETFRHQNENWLEWTPSWGLSVDFPEFQIRYTGRVTTGTGQPGVAWSERATDAFLGADVVVAPGGPLTLQERNVVTHQITFVMPID